MDKRLLGKICGGGHAGDKFAAGIEAVSRKRRKLKKEGERDKVDFYGNDVFKYIKVFSVRICLQI
ncbi:hypothetical protein MHH28_22625 [Paenibacillus sp. FSL K6-1217]|uniref:hypothetical protein n=1 Tax=Paenibacillus sp. FSL K6-1217 TaxID=2921466 RepID=UPI00324B986E